MVSLLSLVLSALATASIATPIADGEAFNDNVARGVDSTPPVKVGGYTSKGCFKSHGILHGPAFDSASLTLESCAAYCGAYKHFAVENGNSCSCSNKVKTKKFVPETTCNKACTGNANEICGGFGTITLFSNPKPTGKKPNVNGFNPLGCFTMNVVGGPSTSNNTANSAEYCSNICSSYKYFALQDFGGCTCGTSMPSPDKYSATGCHDPCPGNPNESCGGFGIVDIYQKAA